MSFRSLAGFGALLLWGACLLPNPRSQMAYALQPSTVGIDDDGARVADPRHADKDGRGVGDAFDECEDDGVLELMGGHWPLAGIANTQAVRSSVTGRFYTFGGSDWGGPSLTDAVAEYDPILDTVVFKSARFPSARYTVAAAESSATGKLYCFGGNSGGSGNDHDEIYEYDPLTDQLVLQDARLPAPRCQALAASDPVTGKIYIFGGVHGSPGNEFDEILEYDPILDRVEVVAHLPEARDYGACEVNPLTRRIYYFGGSSAGHRLDQIVEFDPANYVVAAMNAVLPEPTNGLAAAADPLSGKIYCFGGYGDYSGNLDRIVQFDPATDQVRTISPKLARPLNGLAAASDPGTGALYVFGGHPGYDPMSDQVFRYTPATDTDGDGVGDLCDSRVTTTIEPPEAIAAGAQWRLTSGPDTAWHESGETVLGLAAGTYRIRFRPIYGWERPADQLLDVPDRAEIAAAGAYIPIAGRGDLTCTILPPGAVANGAQWRLMSGPDRAWHSSGDIVSDLVVDQYTVRFRSIYGWEEPADQVVEVTNGGVAEVLGNYSQITQFGDVICTITPPEAGDDGASWRLTSGPDTSWHPSGDVVANLAVGTYTVRFRAIYGWHRPPDQVIEVTDGEVTEVLGNYVQITQFGDVTCVIEPPEAVSDGAQWKLTSGPDTAWHESGDVISDLAIGKYTIRFRAIYGWERPDELQVEVTEGGLIEATGVYAEIVARGAISCTIEPPEAIADGAQWRLTSGPDIVWHANGDIVADLVPGDYTVRFRTIPGWQKPADQRLQVADGGLNTATGVYIPLP